MRSLQDLGKTVLLTTHYLEEAQALADRVAIIKDGAILAQGLELARSTCLDLRRLARTPRHAAPGPRRRIRRPLLHELTGAALARGERVHDLRA